MKHIKDFSDGSYVEYDKGRFDDWCIFLKRPDRDRLAPTDVQYFTRLSLLINKYGKKKLYNDFVEIYNQTSEIIDTKLLDQISSIAVTYRKEDELRMDIIFTILYAGMVAEENKKNAILKKRIKRLGMYQVLIEGKTPQLAANFSKGKKWRELEAECQKRFF